jgi:1-acyl-sn-glycerol-3-phosphate acyltransferase
MRPQFQLQPAHDHGLPLRERALSLRRESGLLSSLGHRAWWVATRAYLRLHHRLRLRGVDHLPKEPPLVLIGNHTSHLDAIVMASCLPWRHRDRVFPIAAGDVFFEVPAIAAFAAFFVNCLPLWRQNAGRHALGELAARLVAERCVYILFPEGRRSHDGELLPFRDGLGMLVAGTSVPVVPCLLEGAHAALPRGARIPRPHRITLTIGAPLCFERLSDDRAGWAQVGAACRAAVEALRPRPPAQRP